MAELHEIYSALKKYFLYTNFKSETQFLAVQSALKREQDVFVSMPAGSGKSLCYQLPGLMSPNQVTIVIEPLLAVIRNQIDYLSQLGTKAASLNSTMEYEERDLVRDDLLGPETSIRFLYITPEMAAQYHFRWILDKMIAMNKVAYFVVDDAHTHPEWGHTFRHDFLKLGELRQKYENIMWLTMASQVTPEEREDIFQQLQLKNPIVFSETSISPNIVCHLYSKDLIKDPYAHLAKYIADAFDALGQPNGASGIIYCRTQAEVEKMAAELFMKGIYAQIYHAGREYDERNATQDTFMNGQNTVICATSESFGMGIKKSNLCFVIHWQMPKNLSAFYQSSGHPGRDDQQSFTAIYLSHEDVTLMRALLEADAARFNNNDDKNRHRAEQRIQRFDDMVNMLKSNMTMQFDLTQE